MAAIEIASADMALDVFRAAVRGEDFSSVDDIFLGRWISKHV
jgi:hypothetical protein